MSESLVEKLNRMQREIDSLKNKPTPKPVNYQEGISLLEEANKNLDRVLSDLNKRYELLEQELNSLKNKKPVDYSNDIKLLNKELAALKNKKPVKQIDYSEDIKKLNVRVDKAVKSINETKSKPVTPLVNEKINHVDHSKELTKINSEIKSIKDKASNKKEINIKEEIENIVNLNYVNRLYNRK